MAIQAQDSLDLALGVRAYTSDMHPDQWYCYCVRCDWTEWVPFPQWNQRDIDRRLLDHVAGYHA